MNITSSFGFPFNIAQNRPIQMQNQFSIAVGFSFLHPHLSFWPQCLLPTNHYSCVELWPLWKALEHVSITITLHKLKACKERHTAGQVKAYWRSLKLGYDTKGIINCIFLLQFHSHSSLLEEHLPILKLLWSISMWSIQYFRAIPL